MKKFVTKFLIFITPFLIFSLYMELNLGKILNSYNYKRKCLEAKLNEIEVLVLGSSQVTYGVNPEFFKMNGFNLSNISQSLFYDKQLTIKYIDKMPKLKYVLINISYFSLGFQLNESIESWRDYYYSQFWDVSYPELNLFDIKRYSKTFLYTPKVSLEYLKKDFDTNLIGNYTEKGYFKVDSTNSLLRINNHAGYLRVMFHNKIYRIENLSKNLTYIDELIFRLIKKNVQVILITPPVYSTYYNYVDPKIIESNYKSINKLCKKYNLKYYDFFKDKRFTKKDFYDNDHMNCIGAEKLSKIINCEILNCEI